MRNGAVRLGLAFVLSTAASFARAQGIELGIKGGASFADLAGADDIFREGEENTRNGFVAGGFLAFPIGGRFLVQPEALFAQKGIAYDFSDLDATLAFDYVEIPLLLKARFGDSGVRPYVFAGPYVGFRTRATVEVDAGEDGTDSQDFEDETKSVDFGAALGAGLEVPAAGGAFLVEARYTRGLTNVAEGEIEDSIKNSVVSFLAGFRF